MKSARIRACMVLVLMLLVHIADAADDTDFSDVSGATLYAEGPYDVLVNGDSTMVFSAMSGTLLQWVGPNSDVALDNIGMDWQVSLEGTGDSPQGLIDSLGTSDDPPVRLYLFKRIETGQGTFGTQPMLICGIDEYDIDDYTYTRALEGGWFHQTWTIRHMHGHTIFGRPEFAGMYDGTAIFDNTCDFAHSTSGNTVLTVEAYTGNTLAGFGNWRDLEVTVASDTDAKNFGVLAAEWPVLKGFAKLSNDALVYPYKEGLQLNDPLTILGDSTKTTSTRLLYAGDIYPDPVEIYRPVAISMAYPNGHNMTMQFFSYFQKGQPNGYLWYSNDETMASKGFIFERRSSTAFDVSFIHYNDNVCNSSTPYSPSDRTTWPKRCNRRNFGPIPYAIFQVPFYSSIFGEIMQGDWTSPTAYYRDQIRDSDAPWVQSVPHVQRADDLVSFYERTGFGVFNAGSQFALTDAGGGGVTNDNFLSAYYSLLYQWPGRPTSLVNFTLGWDFHHLNYASTSIRSSLQQTGKYGSSTDNWFDWAASFGPTVARKQENRDAILDANGQPVLGYLNPFMYAYKMFYNPIGDSFTWREWNENFGDTARTPWRDHRNYPWTGLYGCSDTGYCWQDMDPTQSDFYGFYGERDNTLVSNPFNLSSPGSGDTLSGLYQDIGATFVAQAAFRNHGNDENPDNEAHRAGDAIGLSRVGVGGFVWQAQREMIYDARFDAYGDPKYLLGTEQMSEIFIDLFDFYHPGAHGLGPLRPYSDTDDRIFDHEDGYIMYGDAVEIPMLQFVYHPMMPIRQGIAMLAGGSGSTYDIGDIFYWLIAREYFEYGGIVELEYTDNEMDVLSDNGGNSFIPAMSTQTPSYQLGWARVSANNTDPEVVVSATTPGKHSATSTERCVGDPDKELYLRLAAAIRLNVVPDFLVYGDMRETGLRPVLQTTHDFDYYHYGQRSLYPGSSPDLWEHCSDASLAPTHCTNVESPWTDLIIHTSSWQDWTASGAPTKILHIAANLDNGARNMWVTMKPIPEYTNPAYYRVLILDPTTQNLSSVTPGSWVSFNPAQSKTFFTGNTPAHGVALILVCDTQSCTYN